MKNDLDDLLNDVFGRRLSSVKPDETLPELHAQPRQTRPTAQPTRKPVAPKPSAMHTVSQLEKAVPQMNAMLNDKIAQQREEIEQLNDIALADIKRIEEELKTPEVQSLSSLPKPPRAGVEAFEGLCPALNAKILGQSDFCNKLTIALKRPFVMGQEGTRARGVIFLTGPEDTGRHLGLCTASEYLKTQHVLHSADIAWIDLSLYPTVTQEKLFLQDLFMALSGENEFVAFEHYEKCHPGFLNVLSDLAQKGEHPLSNRYVLQNGRLVETGGALVKDAISTLTPQGKYLVLLSNRSVEKLADSFGAGFISAIHDICTTTALDETALLAISNVEFSKLITRAKDSLQLTLSADAEVLTLIAHSGGKSVKGAQSILYCLDKMYRALAQYKLEHNPPAGQTAVLTLAERHYMVDFGAGAKNLFALLPGEYLGDVESVKQELSGIVGLTEIKEYILSLEENYALQKRRKDAGLKTTSVSMHMIFTGNPGTGKTTIARLVSRYLKAIGVLSGGQLVEVTRADLVGKYVGHTAPLTTQVLKSALGGVLFIDEAYSLYRGKDDSFGLECIDTLVKGMEDYRDDLIVILAGYTKEMQEFLTANSGLKSRFPNFIEFPDYTGEELLEIARIQAHSKGYELDARCDTPLLTYFNAVQITRARDAGNGRLARNKIEEAILAQSRRLHKDTEADLSALLPEDFNLNDVQS